MTEGILLNRRLAAVCLLCILAVTAAAFSPALEGGFVSWDDDVYVTENSLVREASRGNVAGLFSSFVSGNYHPLVFLTYSLEYRLFGLNPRPYHASNLALHLVNTALVYWLILLLGGSLPAALAGTLFFALHPMRVEAVAWVTARKDLLGTAFFLGGLAAYLFHRRERGKGTWTLTFLLFLLALLSKATAVTFPLVLLLCDFLLGRVDRRAVKEKVPFFAAALLFGVVALLARESYQGVLLEEAYTFPAVAFVGWYKMVYYYLVRTFLPVTGIFPLYPVLEGGRLPHLLPSLAAVTGLLAAAVWYSLRHTRKLLFGVLFFVLTLLPSLTVVVVGYSADRFAYLPSVGLAYLAGELFMWLWSGRRGGTPAGRAFLLLLLAAVSGIFALSTRQRCRVWSSSTTLWTHAVESYPEDRGFATDRAYAYYYRGLAFVKEGEGVRALHDLNRAVELSPGKSEFLVGRGQFHAGSGNGEAALRDFSRALEADPRSVEAYNERGILFTGTGSYGKAVADFKRALEVDPGSAMVHLNLAIALLEAGDYDGAALHFSRVLEVDPASGAGHYGRARALFGLGKYEAAREVLQRSEDLGYPVNGPFRLRLQERLGTPHRE